MTVYLGADHGGFELKEALKKHLDAEGYKVIDCGTDSTQSVDYAPIAEKTCLSVLSDDGSLGILCCGTGIGMSMAANKVNGIRAAACSDHFSAKYTRLHNNANILCLGGRVIGIGTALELADLFVDTKYEGGRHQHRLDMITEIEKSQH